MRRLRFTSIVLIACIALAAPTSYGWSPSAKTRPAIELTRPADRYYRTELYLGRAIPGGGEVAAADWEKFLADVVTPRFADGFTIIAADGQYRGRDGSIVKEQSEMLIFLYPASQRVSSSRKIEEIRRAYKKAFKQESVLRVDIPAPITVRF